ncbi:MAG: large conductance mechanosensitive channel protein MscL [Clostridia bacterium]|nr:large conductance mechanosensitive channel protein MscL [Clostridia bacterium]
MGKIVKEFKEFAFKGNVIDMAVGVMIGAAFKGIVDSVVNDLISPIIAKLLGGLDFTAMGIKLGSGEEAPMIAVGNFVQTVINFFIIAICIFLMVKAINKMKKPAAPAAPAKPARVCPYCKQEIADDATRCPHCTSELK